MTEKPKSFVKQTVQRLNTETSPYFKPFKLIGGIMLVACGAVELVALFTPAMPIAVMTLSGRFSIIGGMLFTGSALTRDRNAKQATGKQTFFGTIKNILFK